MKKTLSTWMLISMVTLLCAQEIKTDLIGKKMSAIIKMEELMKSKVYTSDHDIIVPGGMAMPIMYIRTEKDIPNLIIEYTFDKKDSTIRRVQYEWDVRNFEKSDHMVKPLAFDQALIAKYNTLVEQLTLLYGPGTTKGDLTDLSKIEQQGGLQRTDHWTVNNQFQIQLYTAITNYYRSNGMVTYIPTHRIRLYLREISNPVK
ncbi:hypothetical protein DU508_22030 [Pedobacter chinensis]|uniref:DUF4294 domain-containing protein n=1 Tax=Pedobacter chinensis TaxID=2282421 RepID=A0A369PP66_9SPHI|nr:hypothetical protein [Pedobacter chinensis]RDC54401.1 hypothetical protein DU508_22030 [Pedobacter chinensis]